jgi:hypothetical protein
MRCVPVLSSVLRARKTEMEKKNGLTIRMDDEFIHLSIHGKSGPKLKLQSFTGLAYLFGVARPHMTLCLSLWVPTPAMH